MARRMGLMAGLVAVGLPGPLMAECTSGSCYDGVVEFLIAVALYGLIGIVLVVMIAVPRWRRAGLRGLMLVALLAVGVPLVSLAWQRAQLWWMETGEVLGEMPQMADRTPLLIAEDWTCEQGPCSAVLQGRGAEGVTALPLAELGGRDMGEPLILAEERLEQWTSGAGGVLRRRTLSDAERAEVAQEIDYLILATPTWYSSGPRPLEEGLGLDQGVLLRLAMAPVDKGAGRVDLKELDPDYLDLVLVRAALGIPLAPGNWTTVWSDALEPEAVARSLCGVGAADPDWTCTDAAWR